MINPITHMLILKRVEELHPVTGNTTEDIYKDSEPKGLLGMAIDIIRKLF